MAIGGDLGLGSLASGPLATNIFLRSPAGDHARASQVVLENLAGISARARASQVVLENLTGVNARARASQIVLEVVGVQEQFLTVPCGPIPVFPILPAGFPVKWRPTLKTTIGTSSSGREVRYANQSYGLHEFELVFDVLRDQTQNNPLYLSLAGFTDYMQLCQLWLSLYGQFGLFYFSAPWDNSRLLQQLDSGDGTTTEFLAYRSFGTSGAFLNEPVGGIASVSGIYFNGTLQSPFSYSILGNVIEFNVAPPNGTAITATFSFYYLCRFVDDKQDFEEFMKNIWRVQSLKFRSVYWPV